MKKYEYDTNIYNLNDKVRCVRNEIDYMVIRCLKMFKYTNLPDSVDERTLELFLQTGGFVYWTDKPDGVLRVFFGGLGGELDEYYRPTVATIANPYLKFDGNFSIIWDKGQDGDGVVMLNDGLLKGLLPLHRKYATMRVENELSLKIADINARMPFVLGADDERTRASAEEFLSNIYDGKLGVINNSAFLEGLKEFQLTTQHHMLFNGLIEYEQYIRSTWFGELGLNSMFNMKKEAISDAEKQMSEDELLPLVENMLDERKRALELINSKYNTNIGVEFASSWEDNIEEIELNHNVLEAEANGNNNNIDGLTDIEKDKDSGLDGDNQEAGEPERVDDTNGGTEGGDRPTEQDSGDDETGDDIDINVNIEVNSEDKEEKEEDKEEEKEEDEVEEDEK